MSSADDSSGPRISDDQRGWLLAAEAIKAGNKTNVDDHKSHGRILWAIFAMFGLNCVELWWIHDDTRKLRMPINNSNNAVHSVQVGNQGLTHEDLTLDQLKWQRAQKQKGKTDGL